MEELLLQAEKTLYFVSCAVQLARTADQDRYCIEIDNLYETVQEASEQTRERITQALIQMHIRRAEV